MRACQLGLSSIFISVAKNWICKLKSGELSIILKFYLLFSSMLYSDFAAAAVLISFGVIIGTTSPLQLMVMALIEIVLFFINEVIGRKYLKVRQFF